MIESGKLPHTQKAINREHGTEVDRWTERATERVNQGGLPFSSQGPPGGLSTRTKIRGSGDTGFEVLDFRTSGHAWFSTKFLIAFTCSWKNVNDCKFRWFKAFERESSNLLLNLQWPEVLKSRTCIPRVSWSLCSGPHEALGTRMGGFRAWKVCSKARPWSS